MRKHKSQSINTDCQLLKSLLQVEHQNLVHWLHDELGQNLVAIKSFATAIIEQNKDAADDTAELAEFIKQAADQSYRSTYDLMQELRAQSYADLPVYTALETCLVEARLKQQGIDYKLDVDIEPDYLESFTLSIILRSVRSFISFSKQSTQPATLSVGLVSIGNDAVELRLAHRGEFDIIPAESAELNALRKRVEAIDGTMQLDSDDKQQLDLTLKLRSGSTA